MTKLQNTKIAVLKLVTKYVYSVFTSSQRLHIMIDKKHFHFFILLFLSYCWQCQTVSNNTNYRYETFTFLINKIWITTCWFFMLSNIIPLPYTLIGENYVSFKSKMLFLFFDHCFCLICLLHTLVLLNYPPE